uniref:Polyhedrin n=1 Tax=Culex restuans cypovirus TaxID=349066 RepID=Q3HLQ5_9REOV|nr:polyhedrin [Culex restuans cypovirus]
MADLSLARQRLANESVNEAPRAYDANMELVVVAEYPEGQCKSFHFANPFVVKGVIKSSELMWDIDDGRQLSEYDLQRRINGYAASHSNMKQRSSVNRIPRKLSFYMRGNIDWNKVSIDIRGPTGLSRRQTEEYSLDRIRPPCSFKRNKLIDLPSCGGRCEKAWFVELDGCPVSISVLLPRNMHNGINLYAGPLLGNVIEGLDVVPECTQWFDNSPELYAYLAENYGMTMLDQFSVVH